MDTPICTKVTMDKPAGLYAGSSAEEKATIAEATAKTKYWRVGPVEELQIFEINFLVYPKKIREPFCIFGYAIATNLQ